jgi:hypothetical protein
MFRFRRRYKRLGLLAPDPRRGALAGLARGVGKQQLADGIAGGLPERLRHTHCLIDTVNQLTEEK